MNKLYLAKLQFDTSNDWVGGGLGWSLASNDQVRAQNGSWSIFANWAGDPPQGRLAKQFDGVAIIDVPDHSILTGVYDVHPIMERHDPSYTEVLSKSDAVEKLKLIPTSILRNPEKNALKVDFPLVETDTDLYSVFAELVV